MAFDENGPCDRSNRQQHLIDSVLRDRVACAVGELRRTLDAAAAHPTTENVNELREAVDRVLRASARVLIELDRRDGRNDGS